MTLRVQSLSVERGGQPVIAGLSFEVAPGAALILRGPNGIGKTTVLRTLAGLQPPVSGTIDYPEDTAAYASHADGVKPTLTVTENLTFWAQVYGRAVPGSVYAAFDLDALRGREAGTLSAGQKRRLGLARLGVIGRAVLFLDEPTVSLDRFSVQMFATFLRDTHLAAGGIAVIATHIDLGLDAPELDLTPFRALATDRGGSDEAFL